MTSSSCAEDLSVTASILQEILQAFKSESDFERVADFFRPFGMLRLDRADYIDAARLHRRCASQGIAASTVDCQIATAAMAYGLFLLTTDNDFHYIARHCELKLF